MSCHFSWKPSLLHRPGPAPCHMLSKNLTFSISTYHNLSLYIHLCNYSVMPVSLPECYLHEKRNMSAFACCCFPRLYKYLLYEIIFIPLLQKRMRKIKKECRNASPIFWEAWTVEREAALFGPKWTLHPNPGSATY